MIGLWGGQCRQGARLGYGIYHGVLRQITVLQLPFLVLFHQHGHDQPANTGLVGEDADHVGPLFNFLVELLQGVGGVDFHPIHRGKLQMGQDISLGLIHQVGGFREARPELIGRLAPGGLSTLGIGLEEDLPHQSTDQ